MGTNNMRKDLDPEYARSLFCYDPETGLLTRRTDGLRWKAGDRVGYPMHECGYLRVRVGAHDYQVHRIIWLIYYGEWPREQIDHINGVRDDNRICNLRDVDNKTNSRNQSLRETNTSGANGVCWFKARKVWKVSMDLNGRRKHIGYFKDFEDAVEARKQANIQYGYCEGHGKAIDAALEGGGI